MPAPVQTKLLSQVGVRIKEARIAAGLTQKQLGGDVLSRGFISQVEVGHVDPSLASLIYIAARLNIPVTWFLEDTPLLEFPPPAPKPHKWSEELLAPDERMLIKLYRQGNDADRKYMLAAARWIVANCGCNLLARTVSDSDGIMAP